MDCLTAGAENFVLDHGTRSPTAPLPLFKDDSMPVGNLLIAVAISSKRIRAEFKPLLEQLLAAECFLKSLGFASRTIDFADNLDLCIGRLERHYAATQDPLAIVVSDELVERGGVLAPPGQPTVASQEAKEKLDPHYLSP